MKTKKKYKIVKDQHKGYNVMYKKHWYSMWRYCRRPKGQLWESNFAHIWRWDTEKGAQAFINQQLKDDTAN